MCTVSFVPGKDQFYLTSNRDEKVSRKPAQLPQMHVYRNCEMVFPRDGDAGGSWITLCGNGNAGVLLNGGFKNHTKKEHYRKSRGLIFLEIMDDQNPMSNFHRYSLKDIEPFTMIIWQDHQLFECCWDERETKYCRSLSVQQPYIWSSSTLYNESTRVLRENWLSEWYKRHSSPEHHQVIDFHRIGGESNHENNLLMNKNGEVYTVSITSLALNQFKGSIYYIDVVTGYESASELFFSNERSKEKNSEILHY